MANLVDVFERCLLPVQPSWFEKWLRPFSVRIMQKLSLTPEVGSLYKLFSCCLKVSDKLDYFGTTGLDNKKTEDLVVQFLAETLEGSDRFQDADLLVSCLGLAVNVPLNFVKR